MSKLLEEWNQLDSEHKKFVLRVRDSGGAKHGAAPCSKFNDDINEASVSFWTECEKLGFIECIGSCKWITTDKYAELEKELFAF